MFLNYGDYATDLERAEPPGSGRPQPGPATA